MSKIQTETHAQDKSQQQLLEVLKETQSRLGCLSEDSIREIAESLDLPIGEVYGVVTFYSFLSTKPQGRHVIRVCKSLPCLLKDSHGIIDSIKQELGIKPGETTPDGRFSLELVNCIGACDRAPAMLINSHVHGDMNPGKISQVLEEYQ